MGDTKETDAGGGESNNSAGEQSNTESSGGNGGASKSERGGSAEGGRGGSRGGNRNRRGGGRSGGGRSGGGRSGGGRSGGRGGGRGGGRRPGGSGGSGGGRGGNVAGPGDDGGGRGVDSDDDVEGGAGDDGTEQVSAAVGVLEVLSSGTGFIRRPEDSYTPGRNDVHVGLKMIRKYGLRSGDEIVGVAARRAKGGKNATLTQLESVCGVPPEQVRDRPRFSDMGAQHPSERLILECGRTYRGQPDYTNRVIDILAPFGKGQRALIVSPPKAGKTTVLQSVAEGIAKNHPECKLFILLVDERPEEVTEMEMCGFGEVISSSFDHAAGRHKAVAEMTLERARRMVEMGKDVVIILDSVTRLARAYNVSEEGTGRTLTGGLDASSMEKPKRFLGSARKVPEARGGGSLTIIATALIDTGSRMDQVIFEEFKGTGNSEVVLSRELADRRVFPALDLPASATRKEELLLTGNALLVSQGLRRRLAGQDPVGAMNFLLDELKRSPTNEEFVEAVLARSV